MIKLRLKNCNMLLTEEPQKILALSSGKIDKYEYLKGKEILPTDQRRIKEQARFTCSPLGKAFEKQIKTIEEQGEKQTNALEEHWKKLVTNITMRKNL